MRIYILSTWDKVPFAKKLLFGMKNVNIISELSMQELHIGVIQEIESKIIQSDIILAIIDEEFNKSTFLIAELQLALLSIRENKSQTIIPIVLDNAVIPKDLESTQYITCNSNSEIDLDKTKSMLKLMIANKKYNFRRHGNFRIFNNKTSDMIIVTIAIEIFAMLFVVLMFLEPSFSIGMAGMMSGILAFLTLFTSYITIMKRKRQEEEEEEIKSYSVRLKKAIVPETTKNSKGEIDVSIDENNKIDAIGRMMINLEDIKEFYTWSQKQAKASFVLAVSMCILGLILMVAAILLPLIFKLSFQLSIIPAIGGVITELVAGTALVVYRNSLAQLNHYHKALHEDERFLSSVNLLGKFSSVQAQDEMLKEIIRSEIQMNLSGAEDIEQESIRVNKR